jgi:hypothetical protein
MNEKPPQTARLTPEEVERIRKEHRELLSRKDVEARARLHQMEIEQEPSAHYDELRKIRFEEEEKLFKDDPRYVLVTDDHGYQSYVSKEHAESRVHRKKIRKKHQRGIRAILRDYGSIALIVLAMVALTIYAFQLP